MRQRSSRVETGLATDSKVQAEQIRSVAVERIGGILGFVPIDQMHALDEALRATADA